MGIGDFARATHLTAKTLRHYHQIGLLEPAEIDPDSGYRRYGSGQIGRALVIARFRALDMGLDDIRRVLEAPDVETRNKVIAAHLQILSVARPATVATTGPRGARHLITATRGFFYPVLVATAPTDCMPLGLVCRPLVPDGKVVGGS